MEVVHAHCAGLDVHKDTVVACVRHMADGKVTTTVKTFNTATQELLALSDWLSAENATHMSLLSPNAHSRIPFAAASRQLD